MHLNEADPVTKARPPAEWPYFLGSVLITPVAFLVAAFSVGAGDGTFIPAISIFPWSMMTTALHESVVLPALLGSFVQFPIYGVLLALGVRHGRRRAVAIGLAVLHVLAVALAFAMVPATFHW